MLIPIYALIYFDIFVDSGVEPVSMRAEQFYIQGYGSVKYACWWSFLPARLNVTAFMALRLLHLQNKQRNLGLSVEITTKARKITHPFGVGYLCPTRAESLYLWRFQGVWRGGKCFIANLLRF